MTATILVVEDEPAIQELLMINLRHAGFLGVCAATAEEAESLIRAALPDLIILDWMLPGQSCVALAKKLRADKRTRDIPIIMLTARVLEEDKIQGLDAGADDYVTKPFGIGELVARIRAALRHRVQQQGGEPVYERDGLLVDLSRRLVRCDGVDVKLSPKEYEILRMLVTHAGKVLTHRMLMHEIWGGGGDVQYLRIYVRQLRQKLERHPDRPERILTETGVGYRLV